MYLIKSSECCCYENVILIFLIVRHFHYLNIWHALSHLIRIILYTVFNEAVNSMVLMKDVWDRVRWKIKWFDLMGWWFQPVVEFLTHCAPVSVTHQCLQQARAFAYTHHWCLHTGAENFIMQNSSGKFTNTDSTACSVMWFALCGIIRVCVCDTDSVNVNVGGPVWSLAWCPLHCGHSASQYLALYTHRQQVDTHVFEKLSHDVAVIQLHDCGNLSSRYGYNTFEYSHI